MNSKFIKLLCMVIVLEISTNVHAQYSNSILNQLYKHTDEPIQILEHGDSEYSFMDLEMDTPIRFYSKTYSRLYINTNGILTFTKEFPEYLNQKFPGKIPSVAPFFANVDTSAQNGSTIISLFKSDNRKKLQTANELVSIIVADNAFEATTLYVATWENVGYYANQTDKLNTFQAVIICNSNETYVQFIYPKGGINWMQADSLGFGELDFPAQVGFVSDDGTHFMIDGSGKKNVLHISYMSNIGIDGVFLYRVGLLDNDSNISDEDIQKTINDIAPQMSCAEGGSEKCHSRAACDDISNDFCCKCYKGYYGNGLSCIKTSLPIRVSGLLSGEINNQPIDKPTNIKSIIDLKNGLSTTSINSISDELGSQLKLALPVFSSIGWLFAKPLSPKIMNGYQLTGGNLDISSELIFESGEILYINQNYEFRNHQQTIKIEINGHVPQVKFDEHIKIPGFIEELKFTSPYSIYSTKDHHIEIPSKNKTIKFQLNQNIVYDESLHSCNNNSTDLTEKISFLKVSNISYGLESGKHKHSLNTKIGDDASLNPCTSGLAKCWELSKCVPNEESYECTCYIGWMVNMTKDGGECVDIDECKTYPNACAHDKHSYCENIRGGYTCLCNEGYENYGAGCYGDNIYEIYEDDIKSSTKENTYEYDECRKDGNECECAVRTSTGKIWEEDCYYNPKLCGDHASCIRSRSDPGLFECLCNSGFYGDGKLCKKEHCQIKPSMCDTNANCRPFNGSFTCVCNPEYRGNGTLCRLRRDYGATEFLACIRRDGFKIVRVNLDGKQVISTVAKYATEFGFGIDCVERRVYYSVHRKIKSTNFDGTDSRDFITEEIHTPFEIAIDSVSRRIYWSDDYKKRIEVASLDNPEMRTVLLNVDIPPTYIAVDPIRGKLYWITGRQQLLSFKVEPSRIEMSDLDGTDREILFDFPEESSTSSLVLLPKSGELCFLNYDDYDGSQIQCIKTNSKEIRTVAMNLSNIDALTATDESFYWTDQYSMTLERLDFHGTRHPGTPFIEHMKSSVLFIKDVDYNCLQGFNPCQINNGGCPLGSICLPNRNSSSKKSCKELKNF
ncbi:nidogen-like isoform X1 [Episyrphus balteatus]|uniref:nidogen-like isoform X1 n=1 Tax=Episyrphus balteatus TaxID=286459 RepID=UPI0024867431|nr:nidogen-like isoform X1 [Episyrphus balteatus]XP_055846524.1 nidogen-like isoform X1 [Episyrphus balteatus]